MGFFDQFTQEPAGYLEQNGEELFPWAETNRSVWYLLIIVERGETLFYGFTASPSQKQNLLTALDCINPEETFPKLLGVWHGKYYTKLFNLNIEIAKQKLNAALSTGENSENKGANITLDIVSFIQYMLSRK